MSQEPCIHQNYDSIFKSEDEIYVLFNFCPWCGKYLKEDKENADNRKNPQEVEEGSVNKSKS